MFLKQVSWLYLWFERFANKTMSFILEAEGGLRNQKLISFIHWYFYTIFFTSTVCFLHWWNCILDAYCEWFNNTVHFTSFEYGKAINCKGGDSNNFRVDFLFFMVARPYNLVLHYSNCLLASVFSYNVMMEFLYL